MRELYRSEHYVLTLDPSKSLVRGERTATPYKDLDNVASELVALREAFSGLDPTQLLMLFDARRGPMRNDPAFEEASRPMAELVRQFKKSAVLVGTATGLLQMQRLNRQRGGMTIFEDEDKALAYLLAP